MFANVCKWFAGFRAAASLNKSSVKTCSFFLGVFSEHGPVMVAFLPAYFPPPNSFVSYVVHKLRNVVHELRNIVHGLHKLNKYLCFLR